MEPQILRISPRRDFFQRVSYSDLTIQPEPAGLKQLIGLEGNLEYTAWFQGSISFLDIKSVTEIHLITYNPYDLLLHPLEASQLPIRHKQGENSILLLHAENQLDADIQKYAEDLIFKTKSDTLTFLTKLTKDIHEDFVYEKRDEGNSRSPAETFARKSGACRDLTVLFIEICRYVGLASRFASGYFIPEKSEELPELHAWAEIYLPGAGWRGFDPTHGIAVYGRHVVLATALVPENAAPVSGNYRGDAKCEISAGLTVAVD